MSPTGGGSQRELVLVKWGGGLITDKDVPEEPRTEVLRRLSLELAAADSLGSVILGHGSGSYAHRAAVDTFLASADPGAEALDDAGRRAVAVTADAAGRLHRLVVGALLDAGVPAFSWSAAGALRGDNDPVPDVGLPLRLLEHRMLPVTWGDVVVPASGPPLIWSTERVLMACAARLQESGAASVKRTIWLGNTDGILDAEGRRVDRVGSGELERARGLVGGSGAVDVTGGMRLRLETCAELAGMGIESWILDGTRPGVFAAALRGDRRGGTAVDSRL